MKTFFAGPFEFRFANIIFSDMVSKPSWWDDDVTDFYLGEYSEKKFKLFMEVTKVGDLSDSNESEIRSYAIIFKYYLIKEKEEGRTVYEEDGSEMNVSVIG